MARQRQRKGNPVHGWLALDKPLDMTSTQAVGALKRLYNAQKVGHGGTLDPLATGVLPIAFGEATKTVQWAMDGDKEYVFTIEWGRSTATLDAEGDVTAASDVRPSPEAVARALEGFVGNIEQIPPKYSAIKVDGARAYDLARDGETFELKGRPVTVHDAAVKDAPDADHVTLHVRTGKGFYVRALARDLAAALGAEGHVSALRRTRVGPFSAEDCAALEEIEADEGEARFGLLAPVETALDAVPAVDINLADAGDIRQGRTIVLLPHTVEAWKAERGESDDRTALAMAAGQAVALGEVRAGRFQPTRVFQL